MTTRLIIRDTDELNVILERAFAGISNPLEFQQSVWAILERAVAEAYSLGSTKAALMKEVTPMSGFRASA